jgi:hypothetical protein
MNAVKRGCDGRCGCRRCRTPDRGRAATGAAALRREAAELDRLTADYLARAAHGDDGEVDEFIYLTDPVAQVRRTVIGLRSSWAARLPRYGCYCGPGDCRTAASSAVKPIDALDACCRTHDDDYKLLGIGQHNMWTPAGLVRTRSADWKLVACTRRSGHPVFGDDVRRLVEAIFAGRVAAAGLLSVAWPDARNAWRWS